MNKLLSTIALSVISFSSIASNNWLSQAKEEPFSGKTILSTGTYSNSGNAKAFIKCDEDLNFDIIFKFSKYIGSSDDNYNVRYKIDDAETKEDYWIASTQGTALFVSSENKEQLAREIIKGNKIIIEAKDYRGTPYLEKFNLSGSGKAIKPIMVKCEIPEEK